jgi:superoxide oxidase
MSWKNTRSHYGTAMVALHWLTLALIALAYATMELKSFAPKGSALRTNMATLHYLAGLTVFSLVWLRLAVRAVNATPPIQPAPPAWQVSIGNVTHWMLYALMIGLPLLGWLTLSAKGKPISLYLVNLPMLINTDEALASFMKWLHETFSAVGYYVIGLHAAAALFHHYAKRDNTLARMLPARFRR